MNEPLAPKQPVGMNAFPKARPHLRCVVARCRPCTNWTPGRVPMARWLVCHRRRPMPITLLLETWSVAWHLPRWRGNSMTTPTVKLQLWPANGRRTGSQWLTEICCAWVGTNFVNHPSHHAKWSATPSNWPRSLERPTAASLSTACSTRS